MVDKSILRHGGLLAVFALIATGLVAATHVITKDRIAAQIEAQRQALLGTVVPEQYHDNVLTNTCIRVDDERIGGMQSVYRATLEGQISAYAIETTATDGYSGDIDMMVGVAVDGTVLGVRVLKHKETPGLGDKIELSVSDWILSFNGKQVSNETESVWKVKKDGGQFDQFTGATITPRAVVNTVAQTLQWATENKDWLATTSVNCGDLDNE